WKVLFFLELRHRVETPVERETPPVVAAAKLLLVSRALDDHGAAVRTHVREAADLVAQVARQDQRLIEGAGQERERVHLPRHLHEVVVGGVLPRAREHAVALRPEEVWIRVHPCRQGPGKANIRVDLEDHVAHLRAMLSSDARLDTCASSLSATSSTEPCTRRPRGSGPGGWTTAAGAAP